MGTRHLIIAYYNGKYHIAQYGQWDGYPSGQGCDVLQFVRSAESLAKLKAALDAGILYQPTKEDSEEFQKKINELERENEKKRARGEIDPEGYPKSAIGIVCPSLWRDTGAKILSIVADATEPVPIHNQLNFITDGLFCEWAWVVDLDLGVLECWRGGRHNGGLPELSTRFNHLEAIRNGQGQQPTMMATFGLNDLPDEKTFLYECGERED
ncbi:hypothetical protein AURDEDRAFT_151976 [Auricularia subglabra TFB-10046 SS5]|nr:hypothetical protein AURDEDRAFT_151976 [Auricularia subglabra TFB-10046 SS5]